MRLTVVERPLFTLLAVACLFLVPTRAFGQFIVDCSGNTPGAFTTINSVLPLLTDGAVVRITGTCTENVTVPRLDNLWFGAPFGQTMNLQGRLLIDGVRNMFLYGMNVTNTNANTNGDGIDISNSLRVEMDDCTSSNNSQVGLSITASDVVIQNTGSFNNNGNNGINVSGASTVQFNGFAGPISVSNNLGNGIHMQDGVVDALGNMSISNNKATLNNSPPLAGTGFGICLVGHSRAVVYGVFAPNLISGNPSGGVLVQESSEFAVAGTVLLPAGVVFGNVIEGNGPVGITAGLGSQVTILDAVQISNHSDAGVDIFAHGSVFIEGNNQIVNNGSGSSSTYPTRAGVRVDGNSEAFIRGGSISQNEGPGILALVNSSIDLSGATLTSNLGGTVVCDSSAWMVSDLASPSTPFGAAQPCKVPNTFRPRVRSLPDPPIPDLSQSKADEAKYKLLISSF